MTRKQAEELVVGLLKSLFAFAQKRCATSDDAEDLTQEIALRLLRMLPNRDDLQNAKSYCWMVAHNSLSNYYRGKARNGFGTLPENLVDENDAFEQIEQYEIEKRLQLEIAYLSKTQRQVIIMFYYKNMKQQVIADKLGISLAMVKWHLSEAKNDLKRSMDTMRTNSELKFNPIRFDIIGCNGSSGSMGHNKNFLRSSLSQNILYSIRRDALTVNEIADALGVSPVYVESEVDFLTDNGFLIKIGKGYASNCLIDEPTKEINKLHDAMYGKAAELIAPELFDILSVNVKLGEDGVICPRNDMNFAMWSIFPFVAALCDDKSIPRTVSFEDAATIRPDGGQNICYCSITNPEIEPPVYWESVKQLGGPSWNGDDDFMVWFIDSEWSERRNDYGPKRERDYLTLKRFFQDDYALSEDELAYLISRGFVKHEQLTVGERTSLQIVWIKGAMAKERLLCFGNTVKEKYRVELEKLKAPFIQVVMDNTPKHLQKAQAYGLQHTFHCDGWFLIHCLKNLVASGKLRLPAEEQRKSLTALVVTAE